MAQISATVLSRDKYQFQIKIPNFSSKEKKNLEFKFAFNDGSKNNWKVLVYPKSYSDSNYFGVLFDMYYNHSVEVIAKMSFIDTSGEEQQTRSLNRVFEPKGDYSGWTKFISRGILFDKNYGLINNSSITLSGEIKFNHQQATFGLEKSVLEHSFKFQQIFQNRFFTDITLIVEGKQIKAHKVLLAEASPVFYAKFLLFQNQHELEISKVRYETVEETINFIYNNQVHDMNKNVKSLFVFAKMYKIDRLKQYCHKFLSENMNKDNVIIILKLAVRYKGETLRGVCVDYIVRNIKSISQKDWKSFTTEFPTIFQEVFKRTVRTMEKKLYDYYKHSESTIDLTDDSEEVPKKKSLLDYENLFSNMIFPDIELEIQGKTFKAHKGILSTRSTTFFKEILRQKTLNPNSNRLVIEDFDFETIQELVRFIYCEKVLNMSKIDLKLFEAADKFDLPDLKELCADSMGKNLTHENVSKFMELAELYDSSRLKKKTVEYLGRNITGVIETHEWKEFIQTNSNIANEILLKWLSKFY